MINIFLTFCSRSGDNIETYVYRKSANIDIYVHWNLIAPTTWKRSTLDKLVLRAYIIWSNEKVSNYMKKTKMKAKATANVYCLYHKLVKKDEYW